MYSKHSAAFFRGKFAAYSWKEVMYINLSWQLFVRGKNKRYYD